MPTISLRVSEEVKRQLDELARESGMTLSEIVLDGILSRIGGGRMDSANELVPCSLNPRTRLILRNQERLLSLQEGLDEDERKIHAENAEILESGYASEYPKVFASLRKEIPLGACEELYDFLDMFLDFRYSFESLTSEEADRLDERDISFRGFDHNDPEESALATFVEHLFRKGKYRILEQPLKEFSDDGNSHRRNLDMYRRMYRRYKQIRRGCFPSDRCLTGDEMLSIVAAIRLR